MKTILRLSVALFAILPAAQAIAADVMTLPPPPVVQLRQATYDWSGVYAGAWIGLSCLDGKGSLIDNTTPSGPWSNGGCGGKGGGLVGYQRQFDHFVVGAEADLGRSTILVTNNEVGANFNFQMNYLATLRGRAGWALDDKLFYLTAGGAYANGQISGTVPGPLSSITAGQFGWTVGAGLENAVTDHLRLRMEYTYTQFQATKYQAGCCNVDWNWGGEHEVKAAAIWAF